MGVITTLAVVAVAAGAAAVVQKNAADRAASAQKKAIGAQENLLRRRLDPGALNRLAQQFDVERAKSRLELQKEVDPQIAELREFSKNRLLALAKQPVGTRQTEQVARQLFEESIRPDERMERLKDTIIGRAQEDFDAGATLPPEFQAELVRTGIQTGAQAGIGPSGRTVGGVTSRLLGGAGITLKQQRAAEGAALAGTADALARSRQQILANIFPTVAATEAAELGRAGAGLGLAEGLLPESGLSGAQGVDIEIARRKGQANLFAQRGQVSAAQAAAQGQFYSQLIGAGAGALTGGIGAVSTPAPTTPGVVGAGQGALAGQFTGSQLSYPQIYQNVVGPRR